MAPATTHTALLSQGTRLLADYQAGRRPNAVAWLQATERWFDSTILAPHPAASASIAGSDLLRLLSLYDLIHRQARATAPDPLLDRLILRLFDHHLQIKNSRSETTCSKENSIYGKGKTGDGTSRNNGEDENEINIGTKNEEMSVDMSEEMSGEMKEQGIVLADTELYDLVADRVRRRRPAFMGRPLSWLTATLTAWCQAELHPSQAPDAAPAQPAATRAARARRLLASNLRALTPDPASLRHLLTHRYSL